MPRHTSRCHASSADKALLTLDIDAFDLFLRSRTVRDCRRKGESPAAMCHATAAGVSAGEVDADVEHADGVFIAVVP